MANYNQTTFFGPKDVLEQGNADKGIKGTEVDAELLAISTAVASKYDTVDVSDLAVDTLIAGDNVLITLSDTANPLNVGNSNPTTGAHMAFDRARIQAKTDFDTTATLNLNPLGSNVQLSGGGNLRVASTTDGRVILYSDGDSMTEARNLTFSKASFEAIGLVGYTTSDALQLYNLYEGGNTRLAGQASSGAGYRIAFDADPDGETAIYHSGDNKVRLTCLAGGSISVKSNTESDSGTDADVSKRIYFAHPSGASRGEIGIVDPGDLHIINRVHGGLVRHYAERGGDGAVREMIRLTPGDDAAADQTLSLFAANWDGANETAAQVVPGDQGGLLAKNDVTGGGLERVLTTGDLAPTATTTVEGVTTLATAAEVDTGTNNTKAITPLALATSSVLGSEDGSFTASLAGFTGGPFNVDFTYHRTNNGVVMYAETDQQATTSGGPITAVSATLPVSIRPTVEQQCPIRTKNGSTIAWGMITMGTAGNLVVNTTPGGSGFTGAENGGIYQGDAISYCIG